MNKVALFLVRVVILLSRVVVGFDGILRVSSLLYFLFVDQEIWLLPIFLLGLIFVFPFGVLRRGVDLLFYFVLLVINTLINTSLKNFEFLPFYINLVAVGWYVLNRMGRIEASPFFSFRPRKKTS